jgi:hypothetical protein
MSPQKATPEHCRPPPENVSNAAEEIAKDRSKAGSTEADPDPLGGKGMEPKPADGEGQGYSMKEVNERTEGGDAGSKPDKTPNVGEAADVRDVE